MLMWFVSRTARLPVPRVWLVATLLCLLAGAGPVRAAQPGRGHVIGLLDAVRSGTLDETRAVKVSKAQVRMGSGTLVIDDGILVPAAPIQGETLEVAFVGDAWFSFSAPDRVEAEQLDLFTGDSALMASVTRAVLVSGDAQRFEHLLSGERTTDPGVRDAVKLYKEWTSQPERQGFAMDLAMVKVLSGDPRYLQYFAMWCRSPEQGDFFYILDPSAAEPLTLGQFVPLDMGHLDVWQQRYFKDWIRAIRLYGRFADFNVEHMGAWDVWVSSSAGAPDGASAEPEHYVIDLYVNPTLDLDARGSATIRLRAGPGGARTVDFRLYDGVKVTGVYGPGGQPLDFVRREEALHVFLPGLLPAGEREEIRVEYEGDLVQVIWREKSYALRSTRNWYPVTGWVNRATYDVTLRRPKRFAVLGSGKIVEQGVDGDRAWERRTLDLPTSGVTFELGLFDTASDRAGHIDLTFGFQGGSDGPDADQRARIIDTVKRSLAFYEERFGPYPLDYMTIVTVDRGFSQGSLSMLTLALAALQPANERAAPRWRERAEEQTMLTIAHEVSHQWWGNWVGWVSYRDQWLSEAIASYSALLYGMHVAESRAAFLARNALDWKSSLLATTREGRTVASLGPVTLGYRLSSSKSSGAYQAIVYDKGEVVLRMLARLIGEDRFTVMLGEVAKATANRSIDTATFLQAIGHMAGQSLQPFTDRFVYGTAVPEIFYRYSFEPGQDGKGWVIRGTARQMAGKLESFRITKDGGGRWIVSRTVRTGPAVSETTLIVPFQVIITPPESVKKGVRGTIQHEKGFGGRLVLRGAVTPFEYTVPEKPERFELDQLGEVLARFHDEEWSPKSTLRVRAEDLEASGEMGPAEELLGKALESPMFSERAIAWIRSDKKRQKSKFDERTDELENYENARLHTLLARFLVDRGEYDKAEQEILAGEKLLDRPDSRAGWRDRRILRSRIDLARGDPEAAYLRLRNGLVGWWLGAEGYAVMAVVADMTGRDRIAEQALERAEARGVDVRELRKARSDLAMRDR